MGENKLRSIFDKTNGRCHITHKKLCLNHYGQLGKRGAWEVDHSVARARGGTDHGNNLYPALININRQKGIYRSRTVRSWYGKTTAPLSKKQVAQIKAENIEVGFVGGAALGFLVGGPVGALMGSVLGGYLGESIKV